MTAKAVEVVERVTPQIGLPRITATYDDTGVPKVFGVKTSTITRLIGADLSFANLSQDTLNQLKASDIQHIELDLNDAGVFIYVNGQGLPYLAWSEDSLREIGSVIEKTGAVPSGEIIAKAMPLLGKIGIDIVAKFPRADGATEIPVRDRKARALVEAAAPEEPTATIQATIDYNSEGVPSIAGITTRELGQAASTDLSSVELDPTNLTMIKTAGIEKLAVVTQPDGLHVVLNGQPLLHLAYDEQHLKNAIDFYTKFRGEQADEELKTLMENLAPVIQGADIDLVTNFPTE
jgi:hypothetical protein